jgi:IS5 family transposase
MNTQYQINDRFSFLRFLDLEIGDKVPDGNTIWDFKEALKTNGVDQKLFDTFNAQLKEQGIITHKGSIVDATFVTTPVRYTSKKDDEHIKAGEAPQDLDDKCAKRLENGEIKSKDNVTAQMDLDARWTIKGKESFFGYKNHIKCDSESKIITGFSVTDASVHDSQEFVGLINEKDRDVKADSAYVGESFRSSIVTKFPNVCLQVCARAFRNTPLSEADKLRNLGIARVRCRVEHVFGYMSRFMAGLTCRVHGLACVSREVVSMNLAYNLKRYVFLVSN